MEVRGQDSPFDQLLNPGGSSSNEQQSCSGRAALVLSHHAGPHQPRLKLEPLQHLKLGEGGGLPGSGKDTKSRSCRVQRSAQLCHFVVAAHGAALPSKKVLSMCTAIS